MGTWDVRNQSGRGRVSEGRSQHLIASLSLCSLSLAVDCQLCSRPLSFARSLVLCAIVRFPFSCFVRPFAWRGSRAVA